MFLQQRRLWLRSFFPFSGPSPCSHVSVHAQRTRHETCTPVVGIGGTMYGLLHLHSSIEEVCSLFPWSLCAQLRRLDLGARGCAPGTPACSRS